MARTYPNADAVGAAVSSLALADGRKLSAVEQEDGSFVVDGPADILALLDAGPSKDRLKAYAADKRWQVETGGIVVAGASVDTRRDSQSMITAAFTYSQAHPDQSITYKASSGWVTLDAATLATIASAVGAHVQACFAAEASLDVAIDAGTVTTFAEIDSAAWPA